MPLPASLANKLELPVVGSPLFIVSGPELVIAQCKAGIVGSFPALNARPVGKLDEWLTRIENELGEYKALTERGLPPTGTENYGGPVVTAGGLIFIGATADEMIRAFDKDTGKVLWQAPLPFGGNATPSTYTANGRQYVVISSGGGKSGRPAGGSIVAFALPE